MATKLRLADTVVESTNTHVFTVHEGLTYLDDVPELVRYEINDHVLWVGEGCEPHHWIAVYDSIRKMFRIVTEVRFTTMFSIVTEVRFTTHKYDHTPRIETSTARIVKTFDELDTMVKNALFQLSKARKELAEFTRIKRKTEIRNAAGEYEV